MTRRLIAALFFAALALPSHATERTPYVVEYYYKVRWGAFGEWKELFEKNHVPVLKREQQTGRIVEFHADSPRYHGTEDGRWDYRVTITWRDAATETSTWPDQDRVLKELFPDQKTFEAEEQRRFELLLAHWDLPVVAAPFGKP
jgi:hypothetical protein